MSKMQQAVRLALVAGVAVGVVGSSVAQEKAGPYRYRTLTPCRVFDTRETAPAWPLWNPGPHSFSVKGKCGVPEAAVAVSVNVTITSPTKAGDLRLFPGGGTPPLVSTLNFAAGEPALANGAILPLGPGTYGDLEIQIGMVGSGTVHVLLDVSGYFE